MPPRRKAMVLRATKKKIVKETVEIVVIESDKQTQEDPIRSLSQSQEEENVAFEVPIEEPEPQPETINEQQNVKPPPTQVHEPINEEEEEQPPNNQRVDEKPRKKEKEKSQVDQESDKSSSVTREEEPELDKTDEQPQEQNKLAEEATTNKKKRKGKPQEEAKSRGGEKKKRRKSLDSVGDLPVSNYKRYLFRVLKQVHPELAISSQAMRIINGLMNDMFERISEEAAKLSKYTEKKTLSSREIQAAVKLVLPGELGKHAIAEGSKAVSNFVSYKK